MVQISDEFDGEDPNPPVSFDCFPEIDEKLPIGMRQDWLKMRSGVYVQKHRRNEIIEEVKGIVLDRNFGEEIEHDLISELDDDYTPNILDYYWENDEFVVDLEDKLLVLRFTTIDNRKILNSIDSEAREIYLKLRDGLTPIKDDVHYLVLELYEAGFIND